MTILTKKDKLLNRLKLLPNDFTFKEFENILHQFGFKRVKTKAGSHFKWHNSKMNIIFAAPRKNPVKKIYLKQFIEVLNIHFSI